MPFDYLGWGVSSMGGWIVSVVFVLPVAAFLSRVIYKATANPYIHAVAFSALITIMMCSNALTATA
jgi:carbohydrate-selective porin OprB